jgi:hypothetical protein
VPPTGQSSGLELSTVSTLFPRSKIHWHPGNSDVN